MFNNKEYEEYKKNGNHGVITGKEEAIQLMYLIDIKGMKFLEAHTFIENYKKHKAV